MGHLGREVPQQRFDLCKYLRRGTHRNGKRARLGGGAGARHRRIRIVHALGVEGGGKRSRQLERAGREIDHQLALSDAFQQAILPFAHLLEMRA